MEFTTTIDNFFIDIENECLKGKINNPEFSLAGAKISVPEFPEIEGYIVELFSIVDPVHGESRAEGITFEINDWYVRINIYSGWNYFLTDQIKEFTIEERVAKQGDFSFKDLVKNNSFLFKLKNVSGKVFPNFYLDLRGGETSGVGRNEHGSAHFHILERGTNNDLGKVYFPTVKDYQQKKIGLIFSKDCLLKPKARKLINSWVFEGDLDNLNKLNSEWNLRNKYNNRVI